MKVTYRGFEIEAKREPSMAGYSLLYYSVFRVSDGWEMTSGFEDSNEKVSTMVNNLKGWVDDCIANPADYDDPQAELEEDLPTGDIH